MSETKSHFKISLDFFELATFGMNYGLQTVNETVTRCPKVALWYLVPLAAKRFLEIIDTLIFFSANLASKIRQAQMPNGLATGDFGGHCAVEMKRGTSFFNHSWVAHAECDGVESCWKLQDLWPKYLRAQAFNAPSTIFSH